MTATGFKNLLRRKRNSTRVRKFVDVLRESGLHRVECRIPKDAYDRAILSELPKWYGHGLTDNDIWRLRNEYYLGFFAVVTSILLPMRYAANPTMKLEVIYDKNIHEVEKLKAGYRDLIETLPQEADRLVGEPHGETDDDFVALQSADLLAWHIHRAFVADANGTKHQDTVWDGLLGLPKYPEQEWNEANLRSLAMWDRLAEAVAREQEKRRNG